MLVYQISLPRRQDAEAFVTFMLGEYIPAVEHGATRVGQAGESTLLQYQPDRQTTGCRFLWHVDWSGAAMGTARVSQPAVVRKFDAFRPRVTRLGVFEEVAAPRARRKKK